MITAVASTDAGLRWTAVKVDGTSDAKDALDRIAIAQEVIDRIGRRHCCDLERHP